MIYIYLFILTLIPVVLGLSISVIAVYFAWRRGPIREADRLSCALGIALGLLLWIAFVQPLVSHGFYNHSTGSLLLGLFFMGGTPISAAPALLLYGPGRRSKIP